MFRKVDFPSPLAPISPTCSPFNNLKLASSRILLPPKPWVTFSTINKLIFTLHHFFRTRYILWSNGENVNASFVYQPSYRASRVPSPGHFLLHPIFWQFLFVFFCLMYIVRKNQKT